MRKLDNSQTIQIQGSPGVSLRNVSQTIGVDGLDEAKEERERVVKVLFLAANPAHTEKLRLDLEAKSIAEALRSANSEVQFVLEQSWAATYRELQDGLFHHAPDLVHLSGHGLRGGLPVLEEHAATRELFRAGREEKPSSTLAVEALGQLFSVAKGKARCVVLSSCHSEPLAHALSAFVDCSIGMSRSVGDDAAIRFSWAFYHALAHGRSVQDAFGLASAHMGLDGTGENLVPRLFASRTDPRTVIFN